jgi:drug/metabolite transporter (DMT)-like permease
LWRIAGLGFLIIPMNQTLYLLGQSFTAAGHGSIMFATTPVWVFLMSVFYLKEQLFWRRTLGFILALAGSFVIILSGAVKFGTEYLIGDVIIMVSVLAWALYTILGKPLVEKYGALRVTAYAISFGSLMYLPLGVYSASTFDYSKATLLAWLSIIYMAVGMSVIGYVIWYWLLKHMPASRLAVFSNIQPVIATTVAFFALGEQPGVPFFIGASIVLLGVILTEV